MSRSTTRPTAAASCRRRRSAASGLIDDAAKTRRASRFKRAGEAHHPDRRDQGPSRASRSICAKCLGREDGAPPPVDLAAERRNGDFVRAHDRRRAGRRLPRSVRWRAAGGAGRDGDGGRHRRRRSRCPPASPPMPSSSARTRRAICSTTAAPDAVLEAAAGRPACRPCILGATGGDALTLAGRRAISVAELRRINEAWLPAYMAAAAERTRRRAWRWTRRRSSG